MINHHQRAHAIRDARAYLDRLERDDGTLSMVRRRPVKPTNAPDGYPRGGDSVGSHTGHSDPTGGAVESWIDTERTRVADLVDRAWEQLIDAFRLLAAADSCRAQALEQRRPRPAEEGKTGGDVWWCISCARAWPGTQQAIAFNPRSRASKRSRDDLCPACLNDWEASGDDATGRSLSDIRIVIWRHEHPGRYVTETIRQHALSESLKSVRDRAPIFGRSVATCSDA